LDWELSLELEACEICANNIKINKNKIFFMTILLAPNFYN
jgi:hypothetical protein